MSALRRWGRLLGTCVGLLVLYFALPRPDLPAQDIALRASVIVLALVLLAVMVTMELRRQVDLGTDRRIDGLVVAVVSAVVVFSLIFYLLEKQNPDQFTGLHTRIDALYFTMSTLATVGYGDVHATGQAARALVAVQMVFNLVIIGSAASLLTSKVRTAAAQRAQQHHAAGSEHPGGHSGGHDAAEPHV